MPIYAGIGSRETPDDILNTMAATGELFALEGCILRSGGAKGADMAFELGCDSAKGEKEIFRPEDATPEAYELAEKYHPNWNACRGYVRGLHARNGQIVLGRNLDTPVDEVICWTPGASGSGGTGQALRIAKAFEIPVIDLGDPVAKMEFIERLVPLYEKYIAS
jgi:hypothetical protein